MGGRVREAIDPFIVGYAAGVFSTCLRKNDVGVGDIDPQTGEAAVERLFLDELEDMFPLIRLHNAGTSRERAGFFDKATAIQLCGPKGCAGVFEI